MDKLVRLVDYNLATTTSCDSAVQKITRIKPGSQPWKL